MTRITRMLMMIALTLVSKGLSKEGLVGQVEGKESKKREERVTKKKKKRKK